ncbi:hypothetical protein DSECCO2_267290 [anaerobic digester metagenome]
MDLLNQNNRLDLLTLQVLMDELIQLLLLLPGHAFPAVVYGQQNIFLGLRQIFFFQQLIHQLARHFLQGFPPIFNALDNLRGIRIDAFHSNNLLHFISSYHNAGIDVIVYLTVCPDILALPLKDQSDHRGGSQCERNQPLQSGSFADLPCDVIMCCHFFYRTLPELIQDIDRSLINRLFKSFEYFFFRHDLTPFSSR